MPFHQVPFIGRDTKTSTISAHIYARINLESAIRERREILDTVVDALQNVLLVQKHDRRIFTEVFNRLLNHFTTRVDVRFIDSGVGQCIELGVRVLIVRMGRMPNRQHARGIGHGHVPQQENRAAFVAVLLLAEDAPFQCIDSDIDIPTSFNCPATAWEISASIM